MDFTNVFNQAIKFKSKIENTERDYNENLIKIKRLDDEMKVASSLYVTTEMGFKYLETLVNEESVKFTKRLEGLFTYALQTVFFDKDYSAKISVEENKSTIYLCYTDDDGNAIEADIRNSVGGGVRTVIGFIGMVFFANHYESAKMLIVDEGFSQLSTIYMPYLMQLIDSLADKMGYIVVLVTHDVRIIDYAKKMYEVKKGKSILVKKPEEIGEDMLADSGSTATA